MINAVLYILVTGTQWRLLPHDFPPHSTVYGYFWQWCNNGVWERMKHTLHAKIRQWEGRHRHPTAGCVDAQSVKTTQVPGVRGYDKGKQVKGRKRHIVVDTLGLLLVLVVTAASVGDREGARQCLARRGGQLKKLRKVCIAVSTAASTIIDRRRTSRFCARVGAWFFVVCSAGFVVPVFAKGGETCRN